VEKLVRKFSTEKLEVASIKQTINQSINQASKQSINQSIINQSVSHSSNCSPLSEVKKYFSENIVQKS